MVIWGNQARLHYRKKIVCFSSLPFGIGLKCGMSGAFAQWASEKKKEPQSLTWTTTCTLYFAHITGQVFFLLKIRVYDYSTSILYQDSNICKYMYMYCMVIWTRKNLFIQLALWEWIEMWHV